jgi:glutathione S-transferase
MEGLVNLLEKMDAMLAVSGTGALIGERFSLADIAAIPFVMRISELNPEALSAHTAVVAWWQAARARPSFAVAKIESWDLGN